MAFGRKRTLVEKAREQAEDYLDAARPAVESALESAKDFVSDTALPALTDARDKAGPVLVDARDKAAPVLADARDRAVSGLSEARDKAAPIVADARDKAAPYVASGAAIAAERASGARDLAEVKLARLKGEEPPRKKRRFVKFLAIAAVAGGVAVVARKLQGGAKTDDWQSSYTPAPAPSPTSATAAPTPAAPQAGIEDVGGAGPGEAISDAAEAPHPVTSPDEPAQVVEVEPEDDAKS